MAQRIIAPKADLDNLINDLERLSAESKMIVEAGVYDGAGVVADEYRRQIEAVPVDNWGYARNDEVLHGITDAQKAGLLEGMGIAPFKRSLNTSQTKIGISGYNNVQTKKYPNGQPNILIARSICAGTSFRQKFDFAGRAKRGSRQKALETMETTLKKEIAKRTK